MTDNIELLKQISHTLNLHGSVQQNTQLHERIESAIESAATPPDVEQKYFNIYINGKPVQSDRFISGRQVKLEAIARIEDGVWLKRADGDKEIGNDELVDLLDPANLNAQFFTGSKMTIEGSGAMKAGQSAVQDATPQDKIDSLNHLIRYQQGRINHFKSQLSTLRSELSVKDEEIKDRKNRESDLHREIDARDKELSAAQAQAKALSAIKKGLETSLTEALSSLSAAQEENKRLRALGNSAITPPESGEQTK